MNKRKLISCIYKKRALWDKSIKNYNNRDVSRLLWNEVASEMNVELEAAKKIWANLRDQFRKEYKRLARSDGAADSCTKPNWTFYEPMLFLSTHMFEKPHINKRSSDLDINLPEPPPSPPPEQKFAQMSPPMVEELNDTIASGSRKCFNRYKRRKLDVNKEYLNKLNLLHKKQTATISDPDYNFLMSLLPYLKDVPLQRKIVVQQNLLQVFSEEANTRSVIADHQLQQSLFGFTPVSTYSEDDDIKPVGLQITPQNFSANISFDQSLSPSIVNDHFDIIEHIDGSMK